MWIFINIDVDFCDDDDDTSRERPQYQRHQSGNRGSRGHMQQPVEENVTFQILSSSEENIRKAKKSLDEVYKCSDIDASKQKLNDRQVRCVDGIYYLVIHLSILTIQSAFNFRNAHFKGLKFASYYK